MVTHICSSHPNTSLIEDSRAGDLICSECGLVVAERVVDVGTEWRSFTAEQGVPDPSRVGAPENFLFTHGSDLLTTSAFDYNGNETDKRLSLAQRRISSAIDRRMMATMKSIQEMCDRGNLVKKIEDTAMQVFKMVQDTGKLKGKNQEAVSSACVYIACRQEQAPRTFKEICAISGSCSKKQIGACFKKILPIMETNLQQVTSTDFMGRFCSKLDLSVDIQNCAIHVAKKAIELDLVAGRSPVSVAAAAIFITSQASPTKRTAKEVSEVAGAAEVTVRLTYRALLGRASELFPENFKCTTPPYALPL